MPGEITATIKVNVVGQKPWYRREKFWLGVILVLIPSLNEATGLNLSIETILLMGAPIAGLLGLKGVASAFAHLQDKRAETEKAKATRVVVDGDDT